MTKLFFLNFLFSFSFLIGQTQNSIIENTDLSSVKIGSQLWTTQNLSVSTYRNGDVIPQVTDATKWSNLTTGAWCWYNNDSAANWQYGKLYNWFALNDARGIAPEGWHVPSDAEWNILIQELDPATDTVCQDCKQSMRAGGEMKEAGKNHWKRPNTGASNYSGFKDLPGGGRNGNGSFYGTRTYGYWWTSTENNVDFAWNRALYCRSIGVLRTYSYKTLGYSIRLVKD